MITLAHISDVHWRGLSRLAEYKQVFSTLFNELREIKPDYIVICGDIVHSKTQGISPELIEHLTWWFREMADISEVIVTLGNHDGNLMNANRQDAITPILSAIANDKIKLYKKSGTYQLRSGYNLCVFSIFDHDGWNSVVPVDNEVNIAVYHGPVAGSKTDVGWSLEADVAVEFFDKFDFTFLGDIHKMQFLKYRNSKPVMGYSGSTIMQDYGEQPGKGYLLWKIDSRDDFDVEFKKVKHVQEFRTIEWQGSIQKTVDVAKSLASGARIRIKSSVLIPQLEIKQLTTELMLSANASEVVYKDEYVVDANLIKTSEETIEKNNIRDPDILIKLFKNYFGTTTTVNEKWDSIKKLLLQYLPRVISDDITLRNVKWHPKLLKFDNLYGYGADNVINFEKMQGVTGLLGQNRVGKSSIIGAMIYALFNGSDRGSVKNFDIINVRKNYCRVLLEFSISGKDYRVERQSVKHESKNGEHAVTSLNLCEIDKDGNILHDLNGEQRTDTEKVLRSLIGTVEDTLLTAIAVQGDINRFIDSGSTYRDQVMSRFLDLTFFEKMFQCAKEDSFLIKAELKKMPDRDWTAIIANSENELSLVDSEMNKITKYYAEKRTMLDQLKIKLALQLSKSVVTTDDLSKISEQINELKLSIDKKSTLSENFSKEINAYNLKQKSVQDSISAIDVAELNKYLETLSSWKESLSSFKVRHEKENNTLSHQNRSVLKLADVPCGDNYPSCKYIRDSHDDKKKIAEQRSTVESLLNEVKNAESEIKALQSRNIEAKLIERTRLLEENSSITIALLQLSQKFSNNDRELNLLKTELVTLMQKYDDCSSKLNVSVSEEINEIKKNITTLEKQIAFLDSEKVKNATRKGTLTSEINRLKLEHKNYELLKEQWLVYEMFMQATSKKGIPSQIIHTQLPVINSEIEKILHGVVNYTLRLEKDDESGTSEIYIDYGDSKRLIELGSGMEKMISSLAIRVALQNASSLSKPDFFVIDEGFGTLDETNIEACSRLLTSLKKWFKNVIVISHIDGIKDATDTVIEITRIDKDSYVCFE